MSDIDFIDEEELDEQLEDDLPEEEEDELDELSKESVKRIIDRTIQFMDALVGVEPGDEHTLRPYQMPLARRIIESVIINDGEEITALAARQSMK